MSFPIFQHSFYDLSITIRKILHGHFGLGGKYCYSHPAQVAGFILERFDEIHDFVNHLMLCYNILNIK